MNSSESVFRNIEHIYLLIEAPYQGFDIAESFR